jgi:hypothetical protein
MERRFLNHGEKSPGRQQSVADAMLPAPRHSEQNLQFMELESVDAVVARHNATYTV